jgi:hypothetical protein
VRRWHLPTGSSFPWARPRYELALLALVAATALTPIAQYSFQDQTRICLSEALLHGRVSNDECLRYTGDRSRFNGHLYTDKAPGLSLIELPAVAILQPGSPKTWPLRGRRLWGIRVLTVGLCFLLCAFLVGRVSEGLRPGYGGISLVTFALGTLLGALAGVSFEAVPAATFAFGAFLLAWARRPGLAGLAAGGALLIEYENGLMLLVLAAYVYAALGGWRPLGRYAAGVVPSGLLLGAYDAAAFDRPWRLSYRYVDNGFVFAQNKGFFGISLPERFSTIQVFAGRGGLLVASPVLVMAAYGLFRLYRERRAEVAVAAIVVAIFLISNCGYFDPYGGGSPGPRFVAVSLPFLALGLAPAFAVLPRLTLALSVLSVIAVGALNLHWTNGGEARGGVWGELARVPVQLGSSHFVRGLSPSILSFAGLGRSGGAVLVALCAAAALYLGARSMPWAAIRRERPERTRPSFRVALVVVALVYLVVAANVMALSDYPYGPDVFVQLVSLRTTLTGDTDSSYPGGYVNLTSTVADAGGVGAFNVVVTFELSQGLHLAGPPAHSLGGGCSGASTIVCTVPYLRPQSGEAATFQFGVQITQHANQEVTASATAAGHARSNRASFPISVG